MSVVPFPQKGMKLAMQECICERLMNITTGTLDSIADEVRQMPGGEEDFLEHFCFVLNQLSAVAEDLRAAAMSAKSG